MDADKLFAEACNLQSRGANQEAITLLNQVLLEKPYMAPAWNNRAAILQKLGFYFDALMNYERAIQCKSDAAEFYNNRGAAYLDLDKFEAAIADFDRASALNNRIPEARNNSANTLMRLNRLDEAAAAYRAAITLRPDYPDAHLGLALTLLKLGNLKEGWAEFEWRWKTKHLEARNLPYPKWDGGEAKNSNQGLLLYGEQGLGDDLQFIRYAPLAKDLAWHGKVYVEVRQPIARLANTVKGIDGVIIMGDKPPECIETVAPLMTVPHLIWDKMPQMASGCPYFTPDEYRVNIWKEKLKALPSGLLVGICWAGMNRNHDTGASACDARRSMRLEQFRPLTMLKGISWVSLQLGPPSQQLLTPPSGMTAGDWTCELYDFYDTAALIEALDLVITVDTSVAHVAGAIGKPVWMLNRFDGCWRWLHNKTDTQWYPSMRIFNQTTYREWDSVIAEVEVALKQLLKVRFSA